MSDDMRGLLLASARRVFERWRRRELAFRPEEASWQQGLWDIVEELGLPRCIAAETHGGAGLAIADAMALSQLAGEFALPLPLAETFIACHLLSRVGIEGPTGPLTIASAPLRTREAGGSLLVDGTAQRVPWGRDAKALVALASSHAGMRIVLLTPGDAQVRAGSNLAGEPRDTLVFAGAQPRAQAEALIGVDELLAWGAAFRVAQMAGAASEALRLSVEYANVREQFGRTIAKFQAVQQSLAVLAGQVAICSGAAGLATRALESGQPAFGVACAKARAGEAAASAASIAHQIFGAIGFSKEHDLHRSTQRLLAWQDEFGAQSYWCRRIGAAAVDAGSDGLWSLIAA